MIWNWQVMFGEKHLFLLVNFLCFFSVITLHNLLSFVYNDAVT